MTAGSARYTADLAVATTLAASAGEAVLRHWRRDASVTHKERAEPVTAADLASHRIIVDGLHGRFPADSVVSEESEAPPGRGDCPRTWIVDPLDGTRQFLAGSREFVVMIGLVEDESPVLGVIYQPIGARMWTAARGCGALLQADGRRTAIRVSRRTRAQCELRLVVRRNHGLGGLSAVTSDMGIREVVPIGSLGLKAAAIASGSADLFVQISRHLHVWDSCAPEALLREAGGRMTDALGRALRYSTSDTCNRSGLIASNGCDHEFMTDYLHPWVRHSGIAS